LQTNLNQILTVEDLILSDTGVSDFDFNGQQLTVKRLPEYKSRDAKYQSKYVLLDDSIISTSGAKQIRSSG
jgi:hypothetical protein